MIQSCAHPVTDAVFPFHVTLTRIKIVRKNYACVYLNPNTTYNYVDFSTDRFLRSPKCKCSLCKYVALDPYFITNICFFILPVEFVEIRIEKQVFRFCLYCKIAGRVSSVDAESYTPTVEFSV